jgi:hypothetical protein
MGINQRERRRPLAIAQAHVSNRTAERCGLFGIGGTRAWVALPIFESDGLQAHASEIIHGTQRHNQSYQLNVLFAPYIG